MFDSCVSSEDAVNLAVYGMYLVSDALRLTRTCYQSIPRLRQGSSIESVYE